MYETFSYISEFLHEDSLCTLDVDWVGHRLPRCSDLNVSSQYLESVWNCKNLDSARQAHGEGVF